MSSYYELPDIEPQRGTQAELERRLMSRVAQEAQRRLRPVRLKVELFTDTGSNGEGSGHGSSAAAAAAGAESAADATNGASVASGDAISGRAPQAALQQALSHASGGSGGNSASSQAPIPSSSSEGSMLSRHVPGLRHITSRRPAGPLPRGHLRLAVSRANLFRAARQLTRQADHSSNSELTVMYEDALLVIGAELLDLHLASDAASDAEDAEVAASSPILGAGAAAPNSTTYPGPAGLRLAKGRELRSRAAGTAELQEELGSASISALQKSYSLSVSFAQILSITVADEEVTVCYCHNVASQHNNELHFTLAMPSPEDAARLAGDIRQYICKYLQAMLLLQNNYRLDVTCVARLVTLSTYRTCGTADERVLAHSPTWGTALQLPATPQGADPAVLRVYCSSPIGGVVADITTAVIQQNQQGGQEEVKLWIKAQRQPNIEVPTKARDVDEKDSSSQGEFVEPGMDHEVQLYVTATPVAAAVTPAAAAAVSEPPVVAGSPFAVNRLMVASLVLALLAIVLRQAPRLGISGTSAIGDACFLASTATLSAAVLQGGAGGLLARKAGVGEQNTPQVEQGTAWDVRLDAAHPVHDPSMADCGTWSEAGIGEEQLVERRKSLHAPQPSQHGVQDGPFGRFTADEELRFLKGMDGDQKEALRRLHITAEWRRKKGITTILEQPQPAYAFAKGMYAHGVACFTRAGQPVWVDKIADLKRSFPEFKASKWTTEDLYRHAAFCEEWLFRVCAPEPHPLGCRLEVVDLKGMRFTDIGAGWFSWMKSLGLFMQEHYCERMSRCFVINAPGFFGILWRALDPFVTENVKRKVAVVGSDPKAIKKLFLEELHEEDILVEWGGTKQMELYESKWERECAALVRRLNSGQRQAEQ